ncbi:MAG TPA: polyhydroxyalkanoic acid system family protein [Candidatus Acidoferrum sp.]|nr:polyhydroxyalkanoic acid system family protein [Candidatus Acidoferrum sp.]
MHIEHQHQIGATEAIGRINTLLDRVLAGPFPGGVTVQEVSRTWSANILNFSSRVRKGVFGARITGVLRVSDDAVMLDLDVPGWAASLVGEDKIKETIRQQLEELFPT